MKRLAVLIVALVTLAAIGQTGRNPESTQSIWKCRVIEQVQHLPLIFSRFFSLSP